MYYLLLPADANLVSKSSEARFSVWVRHTTADGVRNPETGPPCLCCDIVTGGKSKHINTIVMVWSTLKIVHGRCAICARVKLMSVPGKVLHDNF
jgi:hypothetical protein